MKPCQICTTSERKKAVVFQGQVYLLCNNCADAPTSKFAGSDDVTKHYNLDGTYLKDIKGNKAFRFKGVNSQTEYMHVPNLPYTYQHRQVLNMNTQEIVSIGHDCEIELLPFKEA